MAFDQGHADTLDELRAAKENVTLRQELDEAKALIAEMREAHERLRTAAENVTDLADPFDPWDEIIRLNAELERLRDAIRHVDDLYQQGNTLGFIADAARLGRLLDERPGGAG